MTPRRLLPYLAALLLLAWALGTLARSGTGGTSILSNSYWLVYIVYLLPLFAIGAMVVMVIFLTLNWKILSDALGFGIATRKRMQRKKSQTVQVVVWITFWGLALGALMWRCGGLVCKTANATQTLAQTVTQQVAGQQPLPSIQGVLGGATVVLSDLFGSTWFSVTFLALLVISSVILVRSVMVSLGETRAGTFLPVAVQEQGAMAVQDALRILEEDEQADPRTRIIGCYQRMIKAAANLGAPVGSDQTARELERGIRRMFQLKGRGIRELTRLFEEARYSLHEMTEGDSQEARDCLLEIGEELKAGISVQA